MSPASFQFLQDPFVDKPIRENHLSAQRYRVHQALRGAVLGARQIVTIPAGAIITVLGRSEHLLLVRWNGREVIVLFERDLHDRTQRLNGSE